MLLLFVKVLSESFSVSQRSFPDSNYTFADCTFMSCQSSENGGGINCDNPACALSAYRCSFISCSSSNGGGIYANVHTFQTTVALYSACSAYVSYSFAVVSVDTAQANCTTSVHNSGAGRDFKTDNCPVYLGGYNATSVTSSSGTILYFFNNPQAAIKFATIAEASSRRLFVYQGETTTEVSYFVTSNLALQAGLFRIDTNSVITGTFNHCYLSAGPIYDYDTPFSPSTSFTDCCFAFPKPAYDLHFNNCAFNCNSIHSPFASVCQFNTNHFTSSNLLPRQSLLVFGITLLSQD